MLQTILQAGLDESSYIKTPERERENVSQRSEITAKLSIIAATVHRGRNPPSFVPALQTPPSPRLEQMLIFREAWELVQRLGYSSNAFTHRNRDCWRRSEGRESVGSEQHFSPLLPSTSYWSPKGSGLEVSSSEVSGSNLISWIWKSTTLRGPSGQTYWNPNKQACWEGAY